MPMLFLLESRLLNKFNFGSNSDLRRLNGIGAKKASYIISWREGKETLSSLSQITVIPGISHNAIQRLLEVRYACEAYSKSNLHNN